MTRWTFTANTPDTPTVSIVGNTVHIDLPANVTVTVVGPQSVDDEPIEPR